MKSLSLDMLRMAEFIAGACVCSDDCSSPSSSEREEALEQDDSIPPKTQRRLASFLATHSNRQAAPVDFLPLLMNSPYVNQRRKILNRTILEPRTLDDIHSVLARLMATKFEKRLQELPAEVLCMIEDHLDPSDLVCLGRTCRALFHAVDYQMVDLRNLAFAEDLWPVLSEHGLDFALAKVRYFPVDRRMQETGADLSMWQERYKIMRRIHHDRLEVLERTDTGTGTDWLTCGACVKRHPRKYFSASELCKPAQGRKCLASTAPIRICSHWSEDLMSLRARREQSDCEPRPVDFFRTDRCSHVDHEFQGFSGPKMRDIGPTLSVERSITVLQTEDWHSITQTAASTALRSNEFQDIRLCNHTALKDDAVISSFSRTSSSDEISRALSEQLKANIGSMPDFAPSSCDTCGRSWQFSIFDNLGYRQSPRYALKLIVDEQFQSVRNPWTEEYLRKVEGGTTLMTLMEDVLR